MALHTPIKKKNLKKNLKKTYYNKNIKLDTKKWAQTLLTGKYTDAPGKILQDY